MPENSAGIKNILYHLKSDQLHVYFSPLGASIAGVDLICPDGSLRPISLQPDSFSENAFDPSLSGRTIGPCCGRIKDGEICLQDLTICVEHNEGSNHIHGGSHGLPYKLWDVEQLSEHEITFCTTLSEGTDGYPGNRFFRAAYSLYDNTLSVIYTAETDRPTYVDMTNHIYWDLSGSFDGNALNQTLQSDAASYVCNRDDHIPTKIEASVSSICDFKHPVSFKTVMQKHPDDAQLSIGRGWNNALVYRPRPFGGSMQRMNNLSLSAPDGSIVLHMKTDAPAVVIYTGGFLDEQTFHLGKPMVQSAAVALEAQDIPDAVHLMTEKPKPLMPGEIFKRVITWQVTSMTDS